MSAREPRRTFAAPFVITVIAACGGPVHTNPPPPANPPGPDPTTESQAESTWTIISMEGSCQTMRDAQCPTEDGATCNPPPPAPYTCPAGVGELGGKVVQPAGSSECFLLGEAPEGGGDAPRTPVACPQN